MNFLSNLTFLVEGTAEAAKYASLGQRYIAIGIIRIGMGCSSLAEGRVVATAVKGRARNPEATGKLRSSRILGSSICETVAIYGLVLAILLIFVANPIALTK